MAGRNGAGGERAGPGDYRGGESAGTLQRGGTVGFVDTGARGGGSSQDGGRHPGGQGEAGRGEAAAGAEHSIDVAREEDHADSARDGGGGRGGHSTGGGGEYEPAVRVDRSQAGGSAGV